MFPVRSIGDNLERPNLSAPKRGCLSLYELSKSKLRRIGLCLAGDKSAIEGLERSDRLRQAFLLRDALRNGRFFIPSHLNRPDLFS